VQSAGSRVEGRGSRVEGLRVESRKSKIKIEHFAGRGVVAAASTPGWPCESAGGDFYFLGSSLPSSSSRLCELSAAGKGFGTVEGSWLLGLLACLW
jgi:hypothetical protein